MADRIQSILTATDFSPDANNAVQRAALLADALNASLRIAHSLEPSVIQVVRETLRLSLSTGPDSLLDKPGDSLKALASNIATGADQQPTIELLEGAAASTIPKAATDHDLLVLGAQGRHRFREFALGTTAQRIIEKVECPVLAVRNPAEKPYANVLIATDFSPASERAAAVAKTLAPQAQSLAAHAFQVHHELQMAYAEVDDETLNLYRQKAQEESEGRMKEFLRNTGLADAGSESVVQAGYPPRVLSELAQARDVDLIVLGRRGHSPLDRLLTGSVTQNLLAGAPCDVLVVS